jgi:ADP-ribosylglycohydrolase
MIQRSQLISNPKLKENKAAGCMIGLAIGDALGDLGRTQTYRQQYGIITNLFDEAKSTDDTEFGLLTARILIETGGKLTRKDVVKAWKKYILDEGGVQERGGQPLYGAVANLERGMTPPLSGHDNVGNYDDGAAMRIAPIGIICAGDPERAANLAEIDAEISHCADGIWAAQAIAASIAVAMVNGSTKEIIEAGFELIPKDSWLGRSIAHTQSLWKEKPTIEEAWENLHTDLWTPSHSVAPEAIPQIYAIIHYTNCDFRKGLFWAANFGRDADTITAVVGAISGARYGRDIVPRAWIEKVRQPAGVCLSFTANEDILTVSKQLADLIS